MKNFDASNFGSLKFSYFPHFKFPIGAVFEFNRNAYNDFSTFFDHPNQALCTVESSNLLYSRDCASQIKIKNRISKYLIGLKLSNQENRSGINPYFSASFGMGVSKSIIKELEWEYWYEEAVDDEGEVFSDANGNPEIESQSSKSTVKRQKLINSRKFIYSYEAGFELSPDDLPNVSLQLSAGYTGSFSSFALISDFIPDNYESYEAIKSDLFSHSFSNKSRLALWQFSFGIMFRI